MASPATWRWSWKTTRDSSPTISSSYTPPLVFLSFSLRKTRKLSFSLPPQAFSSLDDNSHTKPSTRNIVIKKKLLLVDMVAVDNPNSIVTKNLEETKGGSSLEGPLWRRIFFVSKKLRGIILLNVLAVIYGTTTTIAAATLLCFLHSAMLSV
ncbi:hypothetical protein GIB67_010896 [Kingdonia uniflora]|uniref:Uncharacterized protein n=1 Tax=Kingdonia uniflora TaxID=39325 RepID=A0A7J7M4P9_9MAGN|nr:hypothetical protein GIB67_010896 [Kingdonia uniflora]